MGSGDLLALGTVAALAAVGLVRRGSRTKGDWDRLAFTMTPEQSEASLFDASGHPYAFHCTRAGRLQGIRSSGLCPLQPESLTHQPVGVYFSPVPQGATLWNDVLLRFPWPEEAQDDPWSSAGVIGGRYLRTAYYTTRVVPPEDIEVWTEDGWEPLVVGSPAKLPPPRDGRWYPSFYGTRHGTWEMHSEPILGFRKRGLDWELAASLSSRNGWRNYSVEGATEQSPGLREALREITERYSEVLDFDIAFDGPWKTVREVLASSSEPVFYHGTCLSAWERIRRQGLRPRRQSGARPAYGAHVIQALPSDPGAVYLTTQLGMARWAARDAARTNHSAPVLLQVTVPDESLLLPDEDSRSTSWKQSLHTLGSVRYPGTIPASAVRRIE